MKINLKVLREMIARLKDNRKYIFEAPSLDEINKMKALHEQKQGDKND